MTTVVRLALKHLTLISDNSPYATHNIIITSEVGDYKTQSKVTAHLNTTINRGYIENNTLNNQIRARYVQNPIELILNELSSIPIQTIYTLQTNMKMKIGNYDLRDGIITRYRKRNRYIYGSKYQFENLSYLKQPIKRVI